MLPEAGRNRGKEERQLRIAERLSVDIIHRVIARAREVVFIIAVEAC